MTTWTRFCALGCIAMGIASAACSNPKYCEGNPGPNNCDLMWDAAPMNGCSSNDNCSASTPVCDVSGSKTCVQCIAPDETSACTGTMPVCAGDHTCQACTMHAQCASNVCLPDGSCSGGSDVAYVDPAGTDNSTCSKAMPCTTVAKALVTNRPYIKFHGTTDEAVTLQGGRVVTLLADPGAVLTRSTGTGPIISVQDDNTALTVYDLSISNAPNNASGRGILMQSIGSPSVTLIRATLSNNPGGGVSASAGMLTISRSTISGNTGGGVSIASAQFSLVNNFIVNNGKNDISQSYGGVQLTNTSAGTRVLEFNTITGNVGGTNAFAGVSCLAVNQAVTFSNNIIYGNLVSGTGAQVGGGGMCNFTYSDIGPQTVTGTGNIPSDPQFVNAAQGDYHVLASSPCKDAADPAATLDVDFDGDTRPQGAGRDIGADEIQ